MSRTFIVIVFLVVVLLVAYYVFVPSSMTPPPAPTIQLQPATTSTQEASTTEATTTESEFKVSIKNRSFSPAVATIKSGTTVIWTNDDSVNHTVDGGTAFKSTVLQPGDTFSYTFNGAGTFTYFCDIHPSMKGKIVVKTS